MPLVANDPPRSPLSGLKRLIFDAIEQTTRLVERTQRAGVEAQSRRLRAIVPEAELVGDAYLGVAGASLGTVRATSRGVEAIIDACWPRRAERAPSGALATPLRSTAAGTLPWLLDGAHALANGVVGDYLARSDNGLDLGMSLRLDGRPIAIDAPTLAAAYPGATDRVVLFVHGLGCTEWSWSIGAERLWGDARANFGSKLQADFGYTPLYLRYNSGLHASENGQRLAALLEQMLAHYPGGVREIALVGHSLGGLIARSAAHYGAERGQRWVERLRHVFCIGSPHLGAPLEKGTNLLGTILRSFRHPGTQVPAEILEIRSAGIKDTRFGYTIDEEWQGRDPDALLENNRRSTRLPEQAACHFIGASVTRDPRHWVGQLFGDLLVRVPSATARQGAAARGEASQLDAVLPGLLHHQLANHPDVYRQIARWIES